MTSPERLAALRTYRDEYYHPATSHERKTEIVKTMVEWAAEEPHVPKCRHCGKSGANVPDERPRCEGHVYSDDGLKEWNITQICEWCFDKVMLPPDDPRRAEWFGETLTDTR